MSECTQLVFSQESVPPVTMAEIVAQQVPGNPAALVAVEAEAEKADGKLGTGAKVGIGALALGLLGVFAGSRRRKGKK